MHPMGYPYVSSIYCSEIQGGGVGIWCKNNIIAEPVNVDEFCIEKNRNVCYKMASRLQHYIPHIIFLPSSERR